MLTIPVKKFDDAKLQPNDKTIYFTRYIREAIEEGNVVGMHASINENGKTEITGPDGTLIGS